MFTAAHRAVWYADLAATIALTETGKSLRSRQPRSMRGEDGPYQQVERWQWHTATPAAALKNVDLDSIIGGAFTLVDASAPADPCVRGAVESYVRIIVTAQVPHDTGKLTRYLRESGCLPDTDTP